MMSSDDFPAESCTVGAVFKSFRLSLKSPASTRATLALKIHAKIVTNTIHPTAIVSGNGRQITVTGPLRADRVQQTNLRVTVTQRTTGAVAEGRAIFATTGDLQQWEVHATIQGNETFQPGPATAVALATTTGRGATDDAHQWLVNINLVSE